jgi:hypothetical protein
LAPQPKSTGVPIRHALAATVVLLFAGCAGTPGGAFDPSDAPEVRSAASSTFKTAASYAEALRVWRTAEELNAWIGARFEYDLARAMQLSETQRGKDRRIPIHRPEEFFSAPNGVCVDLSRFAVETLRAVDPQAKPAFLMIEFAPVSVAGNTLRLHWLASFRRDGSYYFFADSKRPGHIAGPYASPREFIDAYATYRGREVVAFREMDSYERRVRTFAAKQPRS